MYSPEELRAMHTAGRWNVHDAKKLRDAHVEIPAWNGVHRAKFRNLEVSEVTGRTQAYFYIDVRDRQGNTWRTVARVLTNGIGVRIDHLFEPVLKK